MPTNSLSSIADQKELKGKVVLVRSSLNVPVEDGRVLNHFRIMRSLMTVDFLVKQGARVVMCGHIGREKENTLRPVFEYLKSHIPVTFSEEVTGPKVKELVEALKEGEVILLENLRSDPREQKNDADFARSLADLAEVYVNDAFPVSHREHASVVGVPAFLPSYFGINFIHECEELQKAQSPNSPSLFILGGAKFETKMPLVEKFLEIYDHVFVGGALAHDFFKAKGINIGKSLFSDVDLSDSPLIENKKILLPTDVVVSDKDGETRNTTLTDVQDDESIMDAGPETVKMLELFIRNAKTILWNGPLGNYEAGFGDQTISCAKHVAEAEGHTVVGGGDTIAAIETLNNQEKYGFLSSAGGAMLVFLEKGTLPGIEVIVNKEQ